MSKTTSALETPLREQLDRLVAFEPGESPVLSLYLDMRPDQHGRNHYDSFLRKAFLERSRALKGDARKSFDRDTERITAYLGEHVRRSANGLALFACAAANDFFEAVQLNGPVEENWLFVGSVPHLYPLARINDQFPRYAALIVDTNAARLFVFSLGAAQDERQINNVKTRKAAMGGWSQARYQRHVENFHLHHMKEVVDLLDRVVRAEAVNHIVVACDTPARTLLMDQLPQHLAQKIVDVTQLDIRTPEHEVLAKTMEVLREHDADTDVEHVERMLNAWRAGGLAVAGPEDTLMALERRQVEELLITSTPALLRRATIVTADAAPGPLDIDTSAPAAELDTERHKLADHLVAHAHMSSARIRFIEDPDLLSEVGGVGALLRFKM
jgi:peptide chain release factor subunit 1